MIRVLGVTGNNAEEACDHRVGKVRGSVASAVTGERPETIAPVRRHSCAAAAGRIFVLVAL